MLRPALRASVYRTSLGGPCPCYRRSTKYLALSWDRMTTESGDRHAARVAFSHCPHPLIAFYSETRAARSSPLSTVAALLTPLGLLCCARPSRAGEACTRQLTQFWLPILCLNRCSGNDTKRTARPAPSPSGERAFLFVWGERRPNELHGFCTHMRAGSCRVLPNGAIYGKRTYGLPHV